MSVRRLSGSDRLATRRQVRRRRATIAWIVLLLLLLTATVYGLNRDSVRITHVQMYGQDQSLTAIVEASMEGKYFGLIPRNSTFFYSATAIRQDLINAHPEFAAVSLFRSGFTGLNVRTDTRAAIARWCGLKPSVPSEAEYCYVFDASGYIFAPYSSSTPTINPFKVYVHPVGDTQEPAATRDDSMRGGPLRATLQNADNLPGTFDFARQLGTLGSPVTTIVIHDGEVDEYVASGTRVTYVLGSEQNAFNALTSARNTFNLADGSIDYIDLRFDGKVYLKRKE